MTSPVSERERLRSGTVAALVRESAEGLEIEVQGDCMRPWLESGDRVAIDSAAVLWPGDIVAFAAEDGRYLVHRFLGFRRHRGRMAIVTRADDASKSDFPVPAERVLGRVTRILGERDAARLRVPWRVRGASLARWLRLGFDGLRRSWRPGGRRP